MAAPDNKRRADPNCPYCKGTGSIPLLRFSVPCECVKKDTKPEENVGYDDQDSDYWE